MSQSKPARIAIWPNQYKQEEKHPDFRGVVEISAALVQELAAAMQAGQGMTTDINGQPIFKLEAAFWKGDRPAPSPTVTGSVSSLSDSLASQARLAQRQAERRAAAPPAGQWAPPAAPPPATATQYAPTPGF